MLAHMTQLDVSTPSATAPPRPRHAGGVPRRLPLFIWPVVAMVAMLPVLALMIVLLVT
jgi:hypothetical protein